LESIRTRTASHARQLAVLLAIAVPSPAPATELLEHAVHPMVTPTYEGSGQAVEPDVLWVPESWHGYEFWMVMTPYPCGDETHENPSLLASHDGQTWETPRSGGATAPAPLVPHHESCSNYTYSNSDPSIVLAGDTLSIYYFVTWWRGPGGGTTELRRIASVDGVHWTSGDSAAVLWSQPNYVLSPTIVHDDRGWKMWYVRTSSCGSHASQIRERTSVDGLNWPLENDHPVTVDGDHGSPFHLTVRRAGNDYVMLYVTYPADGDCGQAGTLYYAESPDGRTWHAQSSPALSPTLHPRDWDGMVIYRSTFVGRYPNISVWYSAYGDSTCLGCGGTRRGPVWRVGFTAIGNSWVTAVDPAAPVTGTRLHPARPNPFTGTSSMQFDLAEPGTVAIAVFDLVGRRVATLAEGSFGSGPHTVQWNGRDSGGETVAAGIYFVRLIDGAGSAQTDRVIVVR